MWTDFKIAIQGWDLSRKAVHKLEFLNINFLDAQPTMNSLIFKVHKEVIHVIEA